MSMPSCVWQVLLGSEKNMYLSICSAFPVCRKATFSRLLRWPKGMAEGSAWTDHSRMNVFSVFSITLAMPFSSGCLLPWKRDRKKEKREGRILVEEMKISMFSPAFFPIFGWLILCRLFQSACSCRYVRLVRHRCSEDSPELLITIPPALQQSQISTTARCVAYDVLSGDIIDLNFSVLGKSDVVSILLADSVEEYFPERCGIDNVTWLSWALWTVLFRWERLLERFQAHFEQISCLALGKYQGKYVASPFAASVTPSEIQIAIWTNFDNLLTINSYTIGKVVSSALWVNTAIIGTIMNEGNTIGLHHEDTPEPRWNHGLSQICAKVFTYCVSATHSQFCPRNGAARHNSKCS